jgi:hypothetical protein
MIDWFYKCYERVNFRYFTSLTKKKSFLEKIRYETGKKCYTFIVFALVYLQTKTNKRKLSHSIRKDLIVSLTSFPARIHTLWFVLESILRQSIRPAKILIYLSTEDFNDFNDQRLQFLEQYRFSGVEIIWVKENLRSHKKYFYVMQECPDSIIITVDDDLFYPPDTIERLLEMHETNPSAICSNITRKINWEPASDFYDYNKWDKAMDNEKYNGTFLLVAIGYGAVLYPQSFRPQEMFNSQNIRELAFHADDLWLKAVELVHQFSVITGSYFAPPMTTPFSQKNALRKQNTGIRMDNNCTWLKLDKHFDLRQYLA